MDAFRRRRRISCFPCSALAGALAVGLSMARRDWRYGRWRLPPAPSRRPDRSTLPVETRVSGSEASHRRKRFVFAINLPYWYAGEEPCEQMLYLVLDRNIGE